MKIVSGYVCNPSSLKETLRENTVGTPIIRNFLCRI